MHSKEFIEKMRDKLNDEKERLNEELQTISPHPSMDTEGEDNAEQLEADEVNQDIIAQLQEDIKKIDSAITKIDQGTYGKCSVGGEDIDEARLEVLPWAETCMEHEVK